MELDLNKFRSLFISEAEAKLEVMRKLVPELEKEPGNIEIIHRLFRASHSLKGMSGTMGFSDVAELAHRVEDRLENLRAELQKGEQIVPPNASGEVYGGMSRIVDFLYLSLSGLEQLIKRNISGEASTPVKSPEGIGVHFEDHQEPSAMLTPQVRIDPAFLDYILGSLSEIILIKNKWEESLRAMKKEGGGFDAGTGENGLIEENEPEFRKFNRVMAGLYQGVLNLRLLPLDLILSRVPGLVRDLSRGKGINVEVSCRGEDVELDRSLVEAIQDPLFHIIRNAVDHGIETAEDRTARGKSPTGRLQLSAERRRDWAIIRIEDDGKGMDPVRLKERAVEKGFLTAEKAAVLSDAEALFLITYPGFSTAEKVTGVSGRGVGMDLVYQTVKRLGGSLNIGSIPGKGSRFEIKLPVSAAILKLLTVKLENEICAIPVNRITKAVQFEGAIEPDDSWIPVFPLAKVLGWSEGENGFRAALVTEGRNEKTIALGINQIGNFMEAVVRPLGPPLNRLPGVIGVIILASGQPAFVIDPASLI
ncbi:MAG: ATP-binding protein [Proteobacteria bacterium]|nr:ATP-binding protein [Pseudomonadota bacterium]